LLLAAATPAPALAQDLKTYPGAKLDPESSRLASAPGAQCQVYTTSDSFEKLYAFYKSVYKEVKWRVPPPTLPSGRPLQWAFFIIDQGADLKSSKYWLKIQHPYIGTIADDGGLDFKDIRDLSVIQTVRKQ
jgi:hypothetical protein